MNDQLVTQEDIKLPAAAFRASFTRDFAQVNEADRTKYVLGLCKVLDISPVLNPFYFLSMNGRTLLYAGIEAAQLLAEAKKLNIEVRGIALDKETNIYTVTIRVTGPSGRFCDNQGSLYVGGITGQQRANAEMKAITKAQRRAILSYCGLSMTDGSDDDLQGNYAPQNPLAERTQEILAQTTQAEAVPTQEGYTEKPDTAQVDKEARLDLIRRMTFGDGAPFGNGQGAKAMAWAESITDKPFSELTADECGELHNIIDDETKQKASPA